MHIIRTANSCSTSWNYFLKVCPLPSSNLSYPLETGSFGLYANCPSANLAGRASEAHFIDKVFRIRSSSFLIAVGDASVNLNGPVLEGINLSYASVARKATADVVTDDSLR